MLMDAEGMTPSEIATELLALIELEMKQETKRVETGSTARDQDRN